MTCGAQAKIVFAVVFGVISSSLQLTSMAARDTTPENKMNVWTKCKGGNLVLKERSSGLTAHHVYVFRNGESVASTSVPAAGHLKGRLLVNADSSVMLTNLSSDDLGTYRIEVKMSEEKSTERSVRLVVGEPPETVEGKLMAMLDTSNDTVIGLKCGLFTSLGYPPVSAIWKDPAGQLLAGTGFTGAYFTLDLPVDVARSGRYCCHLDCGDPNFCCLDDRSPLRQCAPIDVQTDRKTQNAKGVTEETALEKNFDRLERRVSAMDTIVQELEKSERQQQSQMCVAAMFYQVQREAKCEQLDSSVDKLLELQGELWDELNATKSNLSRALQQSASVGATLTEAFTGQQHETESLTSKMSEGLSDVKNRLLVSGQVLAGLQATVNEGVVNYLSNISQTTGNLHSRIQNDVASVHGTLNDTLNDTLNKKLAKLQDKIEGWTSKIEEVYQTNRNLSDICQQSFKGELIKHHTMMEVWMSKMSLEINETTDELSSTRGRCATVEDGVKEGLKGHKQETEAWMLKMSEEISQIKPTLTALGQLVT